MVANKIQVGDSVTIADIKLGMETSLYAITSSMVSCRGKEAKVLDIVDLGEEHGCYYKLDIDGKSNIPWHESLLIPAEKEIEAPIQEENKNPFSASTLAMNSLGAYPAKMVAVFDDEGALEFSTKGKISVTMLAKILSELKRNFGAYSFKEAQEIVMGNEPKKDSVEKKQSQNPMGLPFPIPHGEGIPLTKEQFEEFLKGFNKKMGGSMGGFPK